MRRQLRLLLVAMLLAATAGGAAAEETAVLCRDQANMTERALGLPPGLLLAVGRVESGRGDPATNDVLPWPWSVNDEGEDHVFNSAFDAIAYVVAARARGSRSIDVGCFQINLQYHPEAFASLNEAFDPATNARAAGDFLVELHGRSGSWEAAVELYHSATPWRGAAYRDLVLARWAEASLAPRQPAAAGRIAASAPPRGAGGADNRSRVTMNVQYPTAPGGSPSFARIGRMPRVIVPTIDAAR